MKTTYKSAGVDIARAENFKSRVKRLVRSSQGPGVLKGVGGFGALFELEARGLRRPVLVSSTDGVGTKLKIASLAGVHDTVGIDAVAMNVNDILCTGARPLFFLDYIAYSSCPQNVLEDLVRGLNAGCLQAGCSLIGGETAQMPGMYARGEYDLAGFCVGSVERDKIIDGSAIRPGDAVIGLESSGLHSNGYSLVRAVFSKSELKRMSAELLKPTRIYVKPVLRLLEKFNRGGARCIRGISHITGGAFYDKIARILPADVNVRILRDSWHMPTIFRLIQMKGGVAETEMYHTLNMGIGMVLVVDPRWADGIIAELSRLNVRSSVIGEAVRGNKKVEIV